MLGVLMASAAEGQSRPARSDVSDVVRGSLVMRLRGPRGGWRFTLAAFALVAPLFLVLTDILQVAFPYWESQASLRSRVSFQQAHPLPGAGIPQSFFARQHVGGLQLLSQPAFLLLVVGHLVVAAAVINGMRRTALAAVVIALAVDAAEWGSFQAFHPGVGTVAVLSIGVFLFEAVALVGADPRAARRREGWEHVVPALVLAIAVQVWALAFDGSSVAVNGGTVGEPTGDALLVVGFVLALLAVLLPLALGLGWRASLLLAAACYPLVFLGALTGVLLVRLWGGWRSRLWGRRRSRRRTRASWPSCTCRRCWSWAGPWPRRSVRDAPATAETWRPSQPPTGSSPPRPWWRTPCRRRRCC